MKTSESNFSDQRKNFIDENQYEEVPRLFDQHRRLMVHFKTEQIKKTYMTQFFDFRIFDRLSPKEAELKSRFFKCTNKANSPAVSLIYGDDQIRSRNKFTENSIESDESPTVFFL